MSIIEKLHEDLIVAVKAGEHVTATNIKTIIGETQRLPDKNPDDGTVVKIVKSLLKLAESITEELVDEAWILLLKRYLPVQVSPEEIEKFIKESIDFAKLPNKKAAIGMVIKNFGHGAVDGKLVTEIIDKMGK
jgi:uncharacterized protein YqeY